MTPVLSHEIRAVLRAPLLWTAVALMAFYLFLQQRGLWPILEGDDGLVFSSTLPLTGGMVVLGVWTATRDRRLGANDLVAMAPASAASVALSRMAALAAVGFAVVFGIALVMLSISFVRGGRGVPDVRLLVDGGLVATLGGALGYVIGAGVRSRIVALLAAPLWVYVQLALGRYTAPRQSVQWLSPTPELPRRSTAIGFLPDIVGFHALYVFALTVFFIALGAQLAQGRRGVRMSLAATAACSLALAAFSGSWLLSQPDDYVIVSNDRREWVPLRETGDRRQAGVDRFDDRAHATTCADDTALRVCVFEAYGAAYAELLLSRLSSEVKLLHQLGGVPHLVRMSVGGQRGCRAHDGELQIAESRFFEDPDGLIPATALCGNDSRAAEAVTLWVHFALGRVTPEEAIGRLQTACVGSCQIADLGRLGAFDGSVVRVAADLAQLPHERVLAGLDQLWGSLRRGRIGLRDLRADIKS